MKTLNDIRKALKPLGYNVKTKTYSFGRHMSFINNTTKEEVPSIFTKESFQEWKPLIDWMNKNEKAVLKIKRAIR